MSFKLPKYSTFANNSVKKPVKKWLHTEIGGFESRRSVATIHASEVVNSSREFCPREQALLLTTGAPTAREYINTSLRYTFDMGYAVEEIVTKYLKHIAVGDWACRGCGKDYVWQREPEKCTKCKSKVFDYKGSRFVDQTTGMSCGLDLLALFPGSTKIRPVELKTMVATQFKTLKAPLSDHTERTRLYLQSIANCGDFRANEVDTSEASILYCCKGFGVMDEELEQMDLDDKFSPFKEFLIKRDDLSVADYSKKSRMYHGYKELGEPMPCGICQSIKDKRAKSCAMVKECFGSDYPAGGCTLDQFD